jgi:ABC-type molybdenum transport system ATPase subunit/photorepair protein PhrA
MRLLSIAGLSVDRMGRKVLDGVDLEIRRGEQWAIFGASGSGKTSLASAIAGKA